MKFNFVHNIDCIDGMNQMVLDGDKVDCIITSPPYNTMREVWYDTENSGYQDGSMTNDEYCKWTVNIFNLFDKILEKDGKVIYNLNYGAENPNCMNLAVADILRYTPFSLADIIIWKKKAAFPANESKNKLTRICELVYIFARDSELKTFNSNKKVTSIRKHNGQTMYENIFNEIHAENNDGVCSLNKATFSTELVTQLLNIYCKPHEKVLDPFMGTGTTGVACKLRGNPFIGFELSHAQCDYANSRIEGTKRKSVLF